MTGSKIKLWRLKYNQPNVDIHVRYVNCKIQQTYFKIYFKATELYLL